jgi:hypothetical protein
MEGRAKRDLGLDKLTELVLSEDGKKHITTDGKPVRKSFLKTCLAVVDYDAELKVSDCYLLKNDPWMQRKGYKKSWMQPMPENAAYYTLGCGFNIDRSRSIREVTPIAFFRKN